MPKEPKAAQPMDAKQSEGKASGDCYVECVKEKMRETQVSSLRRRYIEGFQEKSALPQPLSSG